MKHWMLDLETMSTQRNAAIVAIGAVRFSDDGLVGTATTFYHTIELQSCIDAGLVMDPSTVEWWMKQDWKARQELFLKCQSLGMVLDRFTLFLQEIREDIGEDPYIWGNGCGFDNEILKEAFYALGTGYPWDYHKDSDMRTLKGLYTDVLGLQIPYTPRKPNTLHNALGDAHYQAELCSGMLKVLKDKIDIIKERS